MGRVYNALVKADRLTDARRPIGRPEGDAATRRHGDAATAAAPPPARISDERYIPPTEEASAPSSDFDQLFALVESTAAKRAIEPVLPPAPAPVAASPHRPIAPPVFEEPRQVINVKSLTVAPHIAAIAGSDPLAAERYRTLAVRLSTLAARRKIKSIVVTSADAGEGKSTVAASLAWTLARRGERRVLLLDASLRTASIHQLLGVQPERGWLGLSGAPTELATAMLRIDPNGLYVMTARGAAEATETDAGALDEALLSSRFERLLAQLAAHFDFVIIDAPALGDCAEAQQMAAIADGCVLVARAAHTPHQRLSEATDLVPQERRLGVVLNECEVADDHARRGKRAFLGRLFRR
ncbi:MAG TPA: CpsD/CapB family tyrosine-protein kinase [Blastocatellia bacterium]|nr:CpsD/CapB family tyrosine-protein kinase [Blastocatellia bacterium]